MKSTLTLFFALACGASSAQAATFDCVAPVFPDHSTSNEGVRRVDKQVKQWRACYQAYLATPAAADVSQRSADVEANRARWIASTQRYSNGQAVSQDSLTLVDRDKIATLPVVPQLLARTETTKAGQ